GSGLATAPVAHGQSTGYSALAKGLPTVSRVNVLGPPQYLWSVVRYDTPGNAVREVKQHYKGAGTAVATNYDDNKMEYSFTRQLTRHTRQHYSAGSLSATVVTEHTYDHRDRLLDTWKRLNSSTRTLVSSNGY